MPIRCQQLIGAHVMQTTMKVRLTKGLARHIQTATPSRTVQDLVALLVAMTIVRSRFSVHSLIIKRIVGTHRYGEYLRVMRSLPFITRSENYISRALAEKQGQQAHCKAWSKLSIRIQALFRLPLSLNYPSRHLPRPLLAWSWPSVLATSLPGGRTTESPSSRCRSVRTRSQRGRGSSHSRCKLLI